MSPCTSRSSLPRCTRQAASVIDCWQMTFPTRSAREADSPLEVLKARITTERIKTRSDQDPRIEALGVASFEPAQSLVAIAERGSDGGDLGRKRLAGPRPRLQMAQQPFRGEAIARRCVCAGKIGDAGRRIMRERDRDFELGDGLV